MNIIFYIPRIQNYLEIVIDKEVKEFVVINFSEYFKSTHKKNCILN